MQASLLTSGRMASLLGFFSAFALGCVINVGGGGDTAGSYDCGDLLAHNDDNCQCDAGYERCNPNSDDTDCCKKIGKGDDENCPDPNSAYDNGQCYCNIGYGWCNPNDTNDLSCCVDPGQTSAGTGTDGQTNGTGDDTEDLPTTSGTTGPAVCDEAVDPPGSCDPNTENFFCSHPDTCSPEGSKFYTCEGGVWVETPGGPDENCKFDGFDFGYGCVDAGDKVDFVCGYGPGEDCTNGTPNSCVEDTQLLFCTYGKLGGQDCFTQCTEIGDDMMVLYDFGYCGEQDGVAQCLCCDEGDEGCPINEGGETSTGGDTTTGEGSSSGG